jgi:hypothetical protein
VGKPHLGGDGQAGAQRLAAGLAEIPRRRGWSRGKSAGAGGRLCPARFTAADAGADARPLRHSELQRFSDGIIAFRAALETALTAFGSPDPESLAASVLAEMVGAMTSARTLDDDVARVALRASREQLKRRIGIPPPHPPAMCHIIE